MKPARGKKRLVVGLIMQSLAIGVYLFYMAFVLENLFSQESAVISFFIVVPLAWWLYSAASCLVVGLGRPWAPKLALVRAITTLVALIWLGAVSPLVLLAVLAVPLLGIPLLLSFLVELAAEILFISGGVGAWRSRAGYAQARP